MSRRGALVLLAVTLCTSSCSSLTNCDKSYCGTITLVHTSLSWSAAGFGYNYSGSVDLGFNPAPPANLAIGVQLNGASIDGSAVTSGSTSLHIPVSGSSVACQLTNPSTYTVIDTNRPSPVLAFLTFDWQTSGC